jgi:hypothetical protein
MDEKPKRKISEAQGQALDRGQKIQRANQRRRAADKAAAEQAAAEHARRRAEHECRFGNWEYDFDAMTETRVCRDHECGATETRAIRL